MERDKENKVEINAHNGAQVVIAGGNATVYATQNNGNENSSIKEEIKSRTQEYADKWDENMFLNDFDKRDENAGVNVKLSEVYLDEHLPHYIWGDNENESSDLKDLLSEYIYEKNKNKMLLILGQPGIGKSTLITWIAANFSDRVDDILVYKFASDLKNIEWQDTSEKYDLVDDILTKLCLSYNDLKGKTLIIDGFDEISVVNREEILNELFWQVMDNGMLNSFSLIITCRENYIPDLHVIYCDYIFLQAWDEEQIQSFCEIYQEKTKVRISHNMVENLTENESILGIPLILYMVLGLNISIEKEGSIVDVYDKIFSLEDGGIYDRCLQNKRYEGSHRISGIKEQIHQISRKIAIWIFENNPDEACITQEEYQKICNHIMKDYVYEKEDFKIGNFFKLVKHCEGTETEQLYFVHRSIYEYFVAETIYSSIENAMVELTKKSQKELAGKIAIYLKQGEITNTIGEYLQCKILKLYFNLNYEKQGNFYQWWENVVCQMMDVGMFYYTKKSIFNYKNIMTKEIICFLNLIDILRLVLPTGDKAYIMQDTDRQQLYKYIKFCCLEYANSVKSVNFRKMCLLRIELAGENLIYADFERANLYAAYLSNTNLMYSNLRKADLRKADLREVDLRGADLEGADLRRTKLTRTIMNGVRLEGSIWFNADIKKSLKQLKETKFIYIMVEEQGERKKVYRSELFSDEESLL